MLVAFSFKMEVVMAQFMLDDAFKLILPVLCQVFFIQFDIVGIQQIPASGRFQAAVEVSAVPERFLKYVSESCSVSCCSCCSSIASVHLIFKNIEQDKFRAA